MIRETVALEFIAAFRVGFFGELYCCFTLLFPLLAFFVGFVG